MDAQPGPTIAKLIDPAAGPRPALPRFRVPAPARRSWLPHIFADEIVLCMNQARRPTLQEVDGIAAKIWNDFQTGRAKIGWRDIAPGSQCHRQMVAAARAALGDPGDMSRQLRPGASG
jgi:hypothetical protein